MKLTPKQNPLLRPPRTLGICTFRLSPHNPLRLLERNTQTLRAHARRLLVFGRIVRILFPRRQLLDLVLALFRQAMRDQTDVLGVQCGHEIVPLRDADGMRLERLLGPCVQVSLDAFEEGGDLGAQFGNGHAALAAFRLARQVAAGGGDIVAGDFAGAYLDAEGNALLFPLSEFPAGGVVVAFVDVQAEGPVPDVCFGEDGGDGVDLGVEGGAVGVGHFDVDANGDDDDLVFGDAWGEDEADVVAVRHNHDANDTGGETPGVLPDVQAVFLLAFFGRWVFDAYVVHFAEVLAQTMACGSLDAAASGGDVAFDRHRVLGAGEFLFFRLSTPYYGYGKEFFENAGVMFEDLEDFFASAFFG